MNGTFLQVWPFPLASTMCHGGRVLLQLNGVGWREFLNFLLFGAEDQWQWDEGARVPAPLYQRLAASHRVRLDPDTSHVQELKVGAAGSLQRCHLGMDIPVGGMANPGPAHKAGSVFVGPTGVPFKRKRRKNEITFLKEYQYGHMYLRWDDFGTRSIPLLLPSISSLKSLFGSEA